VGTVAGIPDSGSMCSRLFRATPQQDDPTGEQFEKKPTSTKAAGTLGAHRPDPPTLRKHRNAHPNPQSGTLRWASRSSCDVVGDCGRSPGTRTSWVPSREVVEV